LHDFARAANRSDACRGRSHVEAYKYVALQVHEAPRLGSETKLTAQAAERAMLDASEWSPDAARRRSSGPVATHPDTSTQQTSFDASGLAYYCGIAIEVAIRHPVQYGHDFTVRAIDFGEHKQLLFAHRPMRSFERVCDFLSARLIGVPVILRVRGMLTHKFLLVPLSDLPIARTAPAHGWPVSVGGEKRNSGVADAEDLVRLLIRRAVFSNA
jgi:hypothetical protein